MRNDEYYKRYKYDVVAFIEWMFEQQANVPESERAQKPNNNYPPTPLTVLNKEHIELLKDYCLTNLPLNRYLVQALVNGIGHLQLKWSGMVFTTNKEEFKQHLSKVLIEFRIVNEVFEPRRIVLELELTDHATYTLFSSDRLKRKFVGENIS